MESQWKPWSTIREAVHESVLVKLRFLDGETHIEQAHIIFNEDDGMETYVLFDGDSYNVAVTPVEWMRIPK